MYKLSIFITFSFIFLSLVIEIRSLECYKCQSDEDSGCAIAGVEHVSSWDHETCKSDVDKCAAWIGKILKKCAI